MTTTRALLISSLLFAACVTEDDSTTTPPTQEEQEACGYLNGGDCGGKEDGTGGLTSLDWRSPEYGGEPLAQVLSTVDAYLDTHVRQTWHRTR